MKTAERKIQYESGYECRQHKRIGNTAIAHVVVDDQDGERNEKEFKKYGGRT